MFYLNRTQQFDFRVDSKMFSKEVRNCTVGIIGTGKIGYTEAQLFKGLGAKDLMRSYSKTNNFKHKITYFLRCCVKKCLDYQ